MTTEAMGTVAIETPKFTTRQYKTFWVKYLVRPERNDVVYQFFAEDPATAMRIVEGSLQQPFASFHEKFAKVLMDVFKARVVPDRFDPAYLPEYNSYSVVLRDYAKTSGLPNLLEPLFEELDRQTQG